eukprot:scaffold202958_cov33-Tisochrysis_lutea.AAC.3
MGKTWIRGVGLELWGGAHAGALRHLTNNLTVLAVEMCATKRETEQFGRTTSSNAREAQEKAERVHTWKASAGPEATSCSMATPVAWERNPKKPKTVTAASIEKAELARATTTAARTTGVLGDVYEAYVVSVPSAADVPKRSCETAATQMLCGP